MNEIDRWFERTARATRQPVSLYPCLLTGRILPYFRYRLRYPFLIATVRFLVHVAEFFILLSSLGGVAAFTVMVLRAGSLIVSGGWWGLLEIMRERLRTFARAGDRSASELEIGRWLVLSVFVALIATVAGGAVVIALNASGGDPVSRLYAFLVVLELAIDLPVRVLHSGIYATRRVYKPVWAIFVPTVAQLAILGVGFYLYPTAAIITAIVVSNALSIWITVHFCLEIYRLMGLRPRYGSDDHRFWRHLPEIPFWTGFQATLSGLSLRLDAVLVLALVGFYGTDTRTFDLTAAMTSWQHIDAFEFFYLVMPLFRGTYDSAGIFYFDLVRLRRAPGMRELQLRFFRKLLWAAPVIALFFWSLAAGLGTLVLHDVPVSFVLALLPLFLLRSFIGAYQIRLFAEGLFTTHIATLVLLVVLLALVWINPNPAGDLIQITAAMTVQLIVLINLQHLRDRRALPLPTLVPVRDWMTSLAAEPGPAVVGTVSMPTSILPKQKSAVVTLVDNYFDGRGHVAFRSPETLLYYRRCGKEDALPQDHLELQELTGCCAGRGRPASFAATDGRSALDRAVAEKRIVPDGATSEHRRTLDTLTEDFRTAFPDGIVFDTETLSGAKDMRRLDAGILAQALPAALVSAGEGNDLVRLGEHWMTPVYTGVALRLLFVLPSGVEPDSLREWRRAVRLWKFNG